MIIPVRKVTNFANIIPMTHTVCTLYKQHLLFQTKAAMFKVQMNDKPNLALIKNEAQICKNSPLRLVTIMAILIMEFQVRGAKLKVSGSQKKIVEL